MKRTKSIQDSIEYCGILLIVSICIFTVLSFLLKFPPILTPAVKIFAVLLLGFSLLWATIVLWNDVFPRIFKKQRETYQPLHREAKDSSSALQHSKRN